MFAKRRAEKQAKEDAAWKAEWDRATTKAAIDGYRVHTYSVMEGMAVRRLLFYACDTCGALVADQDTDRHRDWHAAQPDFYRSPDAT